MANNMMNCPGNDTLAELAFSKVSGGTLPPDAGALATHIRTCTTCAAGHAQWLQIAHAGRAAMLDANKSSPCPDENRLAEYFDGVLASDERAHIEQHLAGCGPCVRQLCELHSILSESAQHVPLRRIALKWLREGLRVLETTAETLRPVTLSPAAVLRDSRLPEALRWETAQDGYHLEITVQRTSAGTLTLHLALRQGTSPVPGHRVSIREKGALLESRATDAEGMADFFGLIPSEYAVEVTLPSGPLTIAIAFPTES